MSKIVNFALYHLIHKIKVDINNLIFKRTEIFAKKKTKITYPYDILFTKFTQNKAKNLEVGGMDMAFVIDLKSLSFVVLRSDEHVIEERLEAFAQVFAKATQQISDVLESSEQTSAEVSEILKPVSGKVPSSSRHTLVVEAEEIESPLIYKRK